MTLITNARAITSALGVAAAVGVGILDAPKLVGTIECAHATRSRLIACNMRQGAIVAALCSNDVMVRSSCDAARLRKRRGGGREDEEHGHVEDSTHGFTSLPRWGVKDKCYALRVQGVKRASGAAGLPARS